MLQTMFTKLLLIIISAGAIAAALLVNRQHRIDTAHEIAVLHHRLTQQEQSLWRMETDIAQRLRPQEIRKQLERMGGEWVALPAPPIQRREINEPDGQLADQHRHGAGESDLGG
jgi:hypothetical protein